LVCSIFRWREEHFGYDAPVSDECEHSTEAIVENVFEPVSVTPIATKVLFVDKPLFQNCQQLTIVAVTATCASEKRSNWGRMLKEISRSPSLSAVAKEQIKSGILSGALKLGTHLVETQLAKQFQISRGPLREALNSLAADGFVDIKPGRGAFVINPSVDEMQDMIVLRAVLNGMAARYATASNVLELFETFDRALTAMRAATENDDETAFFDAHWLFFETLFAASNAVLNKAWSSLHGLFDIYVRRMGRPFFPLPCLLAWCESFVALFRAGDINEAEAVLRSQSLLAGFQVLERPIPVELLGYVTHEIQRDGRVTPFDRAAYLARSKSEIANRKVAGRALGAR
jgi:GntR family transcriptional regulator, gluconate operon transcriptional repressor